MSDTNIDFTGFVGNSKETIALRGALSETDFSAQTDSFVRDQLRTIDRELLSIVVKASQEADLYWATALASRDDHEGWDNICRIGTRVKFREGTLSIEWFRNRYMAQGEGKPKKVFSTYIRKGSGFSYSMSSFNSEPTWVRELVTMTEAVFAPLRERAASLTKMRTALRVYERYCNKQ